MPQARTSSLKRILSGSTSSNLRSSGRPPTLWCALTALGEKVDAVELSGLLLEDADELRADDLALLLRLTDAGELVEEAVDRIHIDQVRAELMAEHLHHLLGLALAQEAVVDVHAGQLAADGADEERRDDGGIDAAGEREQHLLVADLTANQLNLVVDEVLHAPVALRAALAEHEIGEQRGERLVVLRPGRGVLCGGLRVIDRQLREIGRRDVRRDVDLDAVHHAVFAAAENQTLDVRKGAQLLKRRVMRVNLAVHAQRTHRARDPRVLRASQIEDYNHVLLQ